VLGVVVCFKANYFDVRKAFVIVRLTYIWIFVCITKTCVSN